MTHCLNDFLGRGQSRHVWPFVVWGLIASGPFAHAAGVKAWHCRNTEFEAQCEGRKCTATTDFTPLSVRVSSRGAMDVCAYSGCWSGPGKVMKQHGQLVVSAPGLRWAAQPESRERFLVVIDESDGVGLIKGAGFAMPLSCEPSGD